MYGTVAQFRARPGMREQLEAYSREQASVNIPGLVATYVYRMDTDPDEYYLAVIFDSKEAYIANAQSPEQDSRYRQLRELLAADPSWHDGEVVLAQTATTQTQ
jgi:quinol monooxygenase YgiN